MVNDYIDIYVPDLMNYRIKYYKSDLVSVRPPRIWPLHLHDLLEIYVLIEGDVSFVVESSLYKLSPGDAVVIRPNERHHCILNGYSKHRHLCFWFDPSCSAVFGDFMNAEVLSVSHISPDSVSKLRLNEIYNELGTADENEDLHMQLYLTLEMLHIFKRNISSDTRIQHVPELLNRILADIDENFKAIRSLEYFTEKYFISASTLNRLFKAHLHTTPKNYIETKRLACSRDLLKKGSTVLSACMESGFPDYSNYIRLFKKRFMMTPRQYRAGCKVIDEENSYEI